MHMFELLFDEGKLQLATFLLVNFYYGKNVDH